MLDPYEALANAIITQAAEDWRRATRRLLEDGSDEAAKWTKSETEMFFLSKKFSVLSNVDGKTLLSMLEREAKEVTAKEVYLGRAILLERRIKAAPSKIKTLMKREKDAALKAASGGEPPKRKPTTTSADIKRQMIKDKELLPKVKAEVTAAIAVIKNEKERLVLHRRFVDRKSLSSIADEMRISVDDFKRLYKQALTKFAIPDGGRDDGQSGDVLKTGLQPRSAHRERSQGNQ